MTDHSAPPPSDACPRCKSTEKAEWKWIQPFPGFADERCQHSWHGSVVDVVQAVIQLGNYRDD